MKGAVKPDTLGSKNSVDGLPSDVYLISMITKYLLFILFTSS